MFKEVRTVILIAFNKIPMFQSTTKETDDRETLHPR